MKKTLKTIVLVLNSLLIVFCVSRATDSIRYWGTGGEDVVGGTFYQMIIVLLIWFLPATILAFYTYKFIRSDLSNKMYLKFFAVLTPLFIVLFLSIKFMFSMSDTF